MKVIIMNEDNHGFIGLAKDYPSAVKFLIDNGWLDDYTEVWVRENEWARLSEVLGEDWADKMENGGVENFNDYWDGSFYFEEREVYGL